MTIVAVIPAFNEEIAIGSVIAKAKQHVDEVLVVDDGSADKTSRVAELAGATVIRHEQNSGKGVALQTAFRWAQHKKIDILVTLDADGQHCADEIPQMVEPILWKQADIVNGARFLEGCSVDVPKYRRVGQEVLTLATNMTASVKLNDSQSGFRAFDKSTFGVFKFNNAGMGVESEMVADAAEAGFTITEVPITCRYDVDGSTFNPVEHGFKVLNSIINQFQKKHPLFYFALPGFISFFIGLSLAFRTLYIFQVTGAFAIGTALIAMTLAMLGSFGMFTGLILNSISTQFLSSKRDIS